MDEEEDELIGDGSTETEGEGSEGGEREEVEEKVVGRKGVSQSSRCSR